MFLVLDIDLIDMKCINCPVNYIFIRCVYFCFWFVPQVFFVVVVVVFY
jgi:hypothetical protein